MDEKDQSVNVGEGQLNLLNGGYFVPTDPMDDLQCESCQ